MRHHILIPLLVVATLGPAALRAQDFSVRLGLKNGHLAELHLGCADGATDDYDRGKDAPAPPPGIGTGYTVLLTPRGGHFYRDVRGPAARVEWTLMCKVAPGKPITVSWAPDKLPPGWTFTAQAEDKPAVDMAKAKSMGLTASGNIRILGMRAGAPKPEATP